MERAKGLLQIRYQWAEERAYFHIRRLSRQKRVPMRSVAAQVVETAKISVVPRPEALDSGEEFVSGPPAPAASGDGLPPRPCHSTPGYSSKTGEGHVLAEARWGGSSGRWADPGLSPWAAAHRIS